MKFKKILPEIIMIIFTFIYLFTDYNLDWLVLGVFLFTIINMAQIEKRIKKLEEK